MLANLILTLKSLFLVKLPITLRLRAVALNTAQNLYYALWQLLLAFVSGCGGLIKYNFMTKKDRQIVFDKYNGKCAYCGCELVKGWHADHIEPIVRDSKWNRNKGRYEQTGTCRKPENETLENYNPACASCNIQKNSFTVEQFRNNIKQFVNSLNQYSTQYKFAKRYGLITETDIEVKFYFEKVGSHCH